MSAVHVHPGELMVAIDGNLSLVGHLLPRVLEAEGATVVEWMGPRVDVLLLVDPGDEHWARAKASGSPVIVLSSQFEDAEPLLRAVESGALGVFSRDCEGIDLMAALRRVASGGVALSRAQTRTLCDALRERPPEPPPEPVRLSKRELQILQSIDAGELIKQTARSLGISPRTVENTQRLMFRKLGVRNRAQAIARAYSLGLIDLPTEHDQ